MTVPTLKRRLACLFYEALLLAAVLFLAGFLVVGLHPGERTGLPRLLYQLYLFTVVGMYFVWFWRHGGQTLAMKTWRIQLVDISGGPVSLAKAWQRYTVATLTFGACFIWAAFDRDRQFLHDRLAGTRLVMKER
jgi:uncharacterized RDD family membrane protein YckC